MTLTILNSDHGYLRVCQSLILPLPTYCCILPMHYILRRHSQEPGVSHAVLTRQAILACAVCTAVALYIMHCTALTLSLTVNIRCEHNST